MSDKVYHARQAQAELERSRLHDTRPVAEVEQELLQRRQGVRGG